MSGEPECQWNFFEKWYNTMFGASTKEQKFQKSKIVDFLGLISEYINFFDKINPKLKNVQNSCITFQQVPQHSGSAV